MSQNVGFTFVLCYHVLPNEALIIYEHRLRTVFELCKRNTDVSENSPFLPPWSPFGPVFLLGVGPLWRYHLNDGEVLHAFVQ